MNADWKEHAAKLEPGAAPAAADTDLTCAITLHNVLGWELDEDMLAAVMTRTARYMPTKAIDIYPSNKRERDGMLEWIMRVTYRSGNGLTRHQCWLVIGCVQRSEGGAVEFHT